MRRQAAKARSIRAVAGGPASPLAALVGTLVYLALPAKRASMHHNLEVILGRYAPDGRPLPDRRRRAAARRLARRQMVAYVQTLIDFFRLPTMLPQIYRDTADTPGWQHVDAALASGRGAVFATIHFGHWDLAGAAVANHCPPGSVYAVAEPFENPRLDRLVTARRNAYGIRPVPMDNVRQMIRVLREGKLLGLLVDRPVEGGDGVPVRFFGRETQIPAGAATLALLARAPLLPGYVRQRRDGSFEGQILPPIEPVRTGDREADVRATMQLVVDALESVIRRSPHQWYMFRPMWPASAGPRAGSAGILATLRAALPGGRKVR